MTIKSIFKFLALTTVGFTVAQGLLIFLFFHDTVLIDQISLHYSDGLTWFVIYLFTPLTFGLLTAFHFRQKNITKGITKVFYSILTLQIAFQITTTITSSNYWGYAFKRPTIFSEVFQADKVITLSYVTTIPTIKPMMLSVAKDTNRNLEELYGRKDPYYGCTDRILMVFEDNSHIHVDLSDFPKIYKDSTKKIEPSKLIAVSTAIYNSSIIDKGEMSLDFSRILNGIIVEFQTEHNDKFLFTGLCGQEISNDHHPFYEFLFKETVKGLVLLKKQRFYYDVAGIEGMEYTSVSPAFSFLLTIILLIAMTPFLIVRYFKQRKVQTLTDSTPNEKQNGS